MAYEKSNLEGKITILKSLAMSIFFFFFLGRRGSLKSVDIKHKIATLKCSWVKRLYIESVHEWKIIPLQHINKLFGKNFKFHFNLIIPKNTLSCFPSFGKNI